MAERILVWLPSPMGDAILCTGALKALRNHYSQSHITFYASKIVRQVLSPGPFCDEWMDYDSRNAFKIASQLKPQQFSHAILFKNSFLSAIAVFMACIPQRTGYARDGRSIFLTNRLRVPKDANGSYKPISVVDYYSAIASAVGAKVIDKAPLLSIDEKCKAGMEKKLPQICIGVPVVVLVPGGAFGPSKLWPASRFAAVADHVAKQYDATVVVSVAPNDFERAIAGKICATAKSKLINLTETPLSLGELKALIGLSSLVITNDTGPRHIAIALGKKVITLFGPNNPLWTQTGYAGEKQIIAEYECAPCDKPKCKYATSRCMEAISVEMVCKAADEMLESRERANA